MPGIFRNLLFVALTLSTANVSFGQQPSEQESTTLLAMRLATPTVATSSIWREGLKSAYIAAYGDINDVPKNWEALVRRTLVCDANEMTKCVETSIAALDQIGGVASLQLGNLMEVRKFSMNLGLLMDELTAARVKLTEPQKISPSPTSQPTATREVTSRPSAGKPNELWNGAVSYGWIAAGVILVTTVGFIVWAFIYWRLRKLKSRVTVELASPLNEHVEMSHVVSAEDPLITSAREILDALHQAESDAEALIAMTGNIGGASSHVDTVKFWRQAVSAGKLSAVAELERRGIAVQLKALSTTDDITMLLGRLLEHASLYSSILHLQNKQDSAIFHWSRQLPSAVIHLHWGFKTKKYMGELKNKTLFTFEVPRAPITMRDTIAKPDDFFDKAARAAITTR